MAKSPMAYKKRQRLIVGSLALATFVGVGLLLIVGLGGDSLSLYQQPTELLEKKPTPDQSIRLGGLVAMGSVRDLDDGIMAHFDVTDCKSTITVEYEKIKLPALFREGQGIISEGFLREDGTFKATNVLAKHDETYMPKEAAPKYSDQCTHPEGVPTT